MVQCVLNHEILLNFCHTEGSGKKGSQAIKNVYCVNDGEHH
jgi:hypothetical protein